MNILVFAHDSSLYGASQSLLTFLSYITKQPDRDVLVIMPYNGKLEEKFKELSIAYKVIPFSRCVVSKKETASILKHIKISYSYYYKQKSECEILAKEIEDYKPDVIYTNTSVVSIGYRLAKQFKIPHVWHIREFGDLDYDFAYLPSKRFIEKEISKSDKSIFVSKILQKHWLKAVTNNSIVIYNGIYNSKELIATKPFQKLHEKGFKIGILGAVLSGKGQDIAIKAFAEVVKIKPNSLLLIYGDALDWRYDNMLKALVKELKIENNVFFNSFVDDKDEVYNNLDILLNCSKMEGFGRTVVEAMLRGIPVIANASGGILEIIEDKKNGLLYHDTAGNLASAMINLLTDDILYRSIAETALKNAQEKYEVSIYAKNIDTIIQQAIAERH